MCLTRTIEEYQVGRRLVRFARRLENSKLLVSCQAIPAHQFNQNDITISCIRWPYADTHWFTSAEFILLLEKLLETTFHHSTKSRIMQNLAFFGLIQVYQNDEGSKMFYKRIMELTARTSCIAQRELKICPWELLEAALNKVLAKSVSIYLTG